MPRTASPFVAALALLAVVAAGCSVDGPPEPAAPPSSSSAGAGPSVSTPPPDVRVGPDHAGPPRPFAAAARTPPSGYTAARCSDLRGRGSSGLAVGLAVPPDYEAVSRDDTSCGFAAGFGREFSVSFGARGTLLREKERNVDPFVDAGGDDSVSDVRYAGDVRVFGAHRGELLEYYCYCDGQDLDLRIAQARGVRLSWTTPHDRSRGETAYRAVTASTALVRSRTSTCTSHGRTLSFRPPIPQTESIDFGGGVCHVYLRPGRASLLRYAEIAVRPRTTLAQLAARLRARHTVSAVRLERGVATLAGRVADRLTWTVTRRQQTQDYQPAGTWRAVALDAGGVRLTWSATPRQWRTERKDAAAFFRSVR